MIQVLSAPTGNGELFGAESLSIMPLGAGSEVGRSCVIVKFKGKTIMLDCGIHPAYTGLAGLPFFDEIDPESVDLALITQYWPTRASWPALTFVLLTAL